MKLRSGMVALVCVALAGAGCAASIGDGDPVGDNDNDPNDPNPNDPTPNPADPSVCVGEGSGTCAVTAECDSPLVCVGGECVAPQNPDVYCDPVESIFCGGENEVCVANVCVVDPDLTGDDTCADPGPGPNLDGTWDMDSTLHLREGLPGLVAGFLDVSELFRDLIDGNINWGLPAPVELIVGALIADIVDQYVPDWAQDLIHILAGFSDVLDDLEVDSTVVLTSEGQCDANYRGSSTWDLITFEYAGMIVSERPEDIQEIGPVTPEDFGARYSCGQLFIDRHRIHNALQGLIRWMIDTLVAVFTPYATIEQALDAAVDCAALGDAINAAYQGLGGSGDISPAAEAACQSYENNLLAQLTQLIDEAAIELSVVSLQGIADIPDGNRMINGVWFGELVSNDFPGEFTANRQ